MRDPLLSPNLWPSTFKKDVLPLPLAPMIAITWPGFANPLSPCSICFLLLVFNRPLLRKVGVIEAPTPWSTLALLFSPDVSITEDLLIFALGIPRLLLFWTLWPEVLKPSRSVIPPSIRLLTSDYFSKLKLFLGNVSNTLFEFTTFMILGASLRSSHALSWRFLGTKKLMSCQDTKSESLDAASESVPNWALPSDRPLLIRLLSADAHVSKFSSSGSLAVSNSYASPFESTEDAVLTFLA